MSTFYKVLSTVKHDGETTTAGRFIEGEAARFGHLVKAGILKVIKGAENLQHAMEIDAAEMAAGGSASGGTAQPTQKNTWEAQPDAPAKAADDEKPAETTDASATTEKTAETTTEASTETQTAAAPVVPVVGTGDVAPVKAEDTGDNL